MAVEQPEVAAVVEREIRIAARPETVFDFFVDPEKGEYVEIDAPNRVVFTWGWEGQETGEHAVAPGSSRVEVELTPDGEGTLVRLRHLDLPEQSREIHGQGWDMYLGRLAAAAEGRDPGADPGGPDNE